MGTKKGPSATTLVPGRPSLRSVARHDEVERLATILDRANVIWAAGSNPIRRKTRQNHREIFS